MKEIRGFTGERVYGGSGGRSYIAEAFETTLILAIAVGVFRSYRVAHEGEELRAG